jgi:5-(carboxyamino)imidazole ribonucleotide synthase
MDKLVTSHFKLGILGGGQLGRMLCLAASNWDIGTYVLDPSPDAPCASVCTRFVQGDFNDYDTVYRFGQMVDMVTIEIEHVNTAALLQLQADGVRVHPDPRALQVIRDKGEQKRFFLAHDLATSGFQLFPDREAIGDALARGALRAPFVQKLRTGGYDGRGVLMVRSQTDRGELLEGPALVEEPVAIAKEIAVIAANNGRGDVRCFAPVEMVFHPSANLVEYLISPAQIDPQQARAATDLALRTIQAFAIQGVLAVEMFLDETGRLLINEVAPRPHNSGHHTIEGAFTSQYEQHLRGIFGLPLGSTRIKLPAVMVNLLGTEGYTGNVRYEGLGECMAMDGVKLHIYGKRKTRPFRKMGHATILDHDVEEAKRKARRIHETLRIIA